MERRIQRQRWSLTGSAVLVLLGLAAAVALLITAAEEFLPDIAGLDYRVVQVGLVLLAVAFSAYLLDRERHLRKLERRVQEEHQEAERLRTMDEMKNAFLRAISHDLRSPLTVILGMAHLLEGRGEDLPAEKLRDAAHRIGSQARRLDSMLTDLLDLERVARGMVQLHAEEIDVTDVFRRVVKSIGMGDHPVELPTEPLLMRADETLVERILDNLVRNAVKYTPDGTSIWVRAQPAETGTLITVEDAGPGVADGLKEEIFELLRRGDVPEGVTGTGVGLSLVRQFAELHGGRAWVEDRPGGGASFKILLAEASRTEDLEPSPAQ